MYAYRVNACQIIYLEPTTSKPLCTDVLMEMLCGLVDVRNNSTSQDSNLPEIYVSICCFGTLPTSGGQMISLCSQKLNHSEGEAEIVIIQAFDTCPMISLCDY